MDPLKPSPTPYSPEALYLVYDAAQTQNRKALRWYDHVRKELASPFHRGDGQGANVARQRAQGDGDTATDDGYGYSPEATAYQLISFVGPQLVYGKPRVRLKTRAAGWTSAAQEIALGEEATNQWISDTRYRRVQEQQYVDPLIAFGATQVTTEEPPYKYNGPDALAVPSSWPYVQRISPRNFLFDPLALVIEESDFYGHRWVMRKEELEDWVKAHPSDGWDLETIQHLPAEGFSKSYRAPQAVSTNAHRDELTIVEFWFKSYELGDDNPWGVPASPGRDKGYRGTLFTLAISADLAAKTKGAEGVAHVRDPRPYYGHRNGPYYICGMYRVPDDPVPLGPLIATYGQSRDNDDTAKALSMQIMRRKRLGGVETDDGELANKLQHEQYDSLIPLDPSEKPANQRVFQLEVGGLDPHALQYQEIARERLRRAIGMGEAQSGNAPGSATATAVAVASQDAGLRMSNYVEQWVRYQSEVLEAVAFGIMCSNSVQVALSAERVARLGITQDSDGKPLQPGDEVWFQGGGLTPEEFYRLEFELDATSMTRESEQLVQQQAMQAFTLLEQTKPLMLQLGPAGREHYEALFRSMGDAMNLPQLEEHVRRFYDAMDAMGGQMGMMGGMPGQEQQGGAQQPQMPQLRLVQGGETGNRTPGLQGVQQSAPLAGVGGGLQ